MRRTIDQAGRVMGGRFPVLAAAFVAGVAAAPAAAQDWKPERAVEIIVGASPGGGQDKTARLVQSILTERRLIDVPVTVANRAGGGGSIGWIYLNQRPGDSHFLELGNTTLLTNHILGRSTISPADVTPVAILLSESVALSVREASPLRSGRDLIERLRRDPASVSVSIGSSPGGPNHMALIMIARAAGADPRLLKTVVFKGGGDAMTALLGGHIDVVSSAANNVISHVKAGRLRVIGVTAPQRLGGTFATAATWREQGVNAVISNWRIVAAPRGTPSAQVAWWENALSRVVETEEWKKDLAQNDFEGLFMKSQETARYVRSQYDDFRSMLTDIGLAR